MARFVSRGLAMVGAGLVVAALSLLLGATPAAAHVTVNSSNATQGGFAKLTFRVPNEKATASTVKLEVVIPTDQPIANMSVKPVPGWTAAMERVKFETPISNGDGEVTEAVSKITWTASPSSAVRPGEFQEFDVSAGPLPEVDELVFKALQTYSDGEIVRWIEEPTAGQEAEHPAPVLRLAKKAADASTGGGGGGIAPVTNPSDTDRDSGWAIAFALVAFVVAVAAFVVALTGRRPRRSGNAAGA